MLVQEAPTVCQSAMPSCLARIMAGNVGLAVWERPGSDLPAGAVEALLAMPPFLQAAVGTPEGAADQLARAVPPVALLRADVVALGRVFASVTGGDELRPRLEHVVDNACHRFHVDRVGLRLLCTYAGPGTEWVDADGAIRRLPPFAVGLFRGTRHPDRAVRVLHRSPPVEHLRRVSAPASCCASIKPATFPGPSGERRWRHAPARHRAVRLPRREKNHADQPRGRRPRGVFVGIGMDEAGLRRALKACLVTEVEWQARPGSWIGLADPFPRWSGEA